MQARYVCIYPNWYDFLRVEYLNTESVVQLLKSSFPIPDKSTFDEIEFLTEWNLDPNNSRKYIFFI